MKILAIVHQQILTMLLQDFLTSLGHEFSAFPSFDAFALAQQAEPGCPEVLIVDQYLWDADSPGRLSCLDGQSPAPALILIQDPSAPPFDLAGEDRLIGLISKPVHLFELEILLERWRGRAPAKA